MNSALGKIHFIPSPILIRKAKNRMVFKTPFLIQMQPVMFLN
jgi:hypothetical protein